MNKEKIDLLIVWLLVIIGFGVGFLYGYLVGINELTELYNSCRESALPFVTFEGVF